MILPIEGTKLYPFSSKNLGSLRLTFTMFSVSRFCSKPCASPPGDGYYLAVGGAVAQHNWSHITTVLQDQKFRCQLMDSSEDLGMLSIQGPAR